MIDLEAKNDDYLCPCRLFFLSIFTLSRRIDLSSSLKYYFGSLWNRYFLFKSHLTTPFEFSFFFSCSYSGTSGLSDTKVGFLFYLYWFVYNYFILLNEVPTDFVRLLWTGLLFSLCESVIKFHITCTRSRSVCSWRLSKSFNFRLKLGISLFIYFYYYTVLVFILYNTWLDDIAIYVIRARAYWLLCIRFNGTLLFMKWAKRGIRFALR